MFLFEYNRVNYKEYFTIILNEKAYMFYG